MYSMYSMYTIQGRLPIRVTLKGLSEDDLYRILTEPVTNLIRQQVNSMLRLIYYKYVDLHLFRAMLS